MAASYLFLFLYCFHDKDLAFFLRNPKFHLPISHSRAAYEVHRRAMMFSILLMYDCHANLVFVAVHYVRYVLLVVFHVVFQFVSLEYVHHAIQYHRNVPYHRNARVHHKYPKEMIFILNICIWMK